MSSAGRWSGRWMGTRCGCGSRAGWKKCATSGSTRRRCTIRSAARSRAGARPPRSTGASSATGRCGSSDVQLRDRYGRLLAYVWVKRADGMEVMVNAELVRLGYAQVMTVPPNVRHAELFRKLAVEAREHRRGLWAP